MEFWLVISAYSREDIYYIDPSMKSVVVFTTTKRNRKGSLIRYYPASYNPSYIIYAKPDNYRIYDCQSPDKQKRICVEFPESYHFTVLQRDSLHIYVRPASELPETLVNALNIPPEEINEWFVFIANARLLSQRKTRFYDYLSMSFVFPYGFEIYNYYATAPGKWRIVGNTVNYYAKKIERSRIYIVFRPIYDSMIAELTKLARRPVERTKEVVKVEKPPEEKPIAQVFFASGSAELTESYKRKLREVVSNGLLKDAKEIVIYGSTDNVKIGPRLKHIYQSNWELGYWRAKKVAEYLVSLGVPESKIKIVSLGEHHPIAPNDTPENRAKNRRADIYIVS